MSIVELGEADYVYKRAAEESVLHRGTASYTADLLDSDM